MDVVFLIKSHRKEFWEKGRQWMALLSLLKFSRVSEKSI